jgi:hypothetical protein
MRRIFQFAAFGIDTYGHEALEDVVALVLPQHHHTGMLAPFCATTISCERVAASFR